MWPWDIVKMFVVILTELSWPRNSTGRAADFPLFTVFYTLLVLLSASGIPQCVVHSLYGSKTRGPEDDSV